MKTVVKIQMNTKSNKIGTSQPSLVAGTSQPFLGLGHCNKNSFFTLTMQSNKSEAIWKWQEIQYFWYCKKGSLNEQLSVLWKHNDLLPKLWLTATLHSILGFALLHILILFVFLICWTRQVIPVWYWERQTRVRDWQDIDLVCKSSCSSLDATQNVFSVSGNEHSSF